MNGCKFTKEDFTEEQLYLLRLAFKLVDEIGEMQRYYHYDYDNMSNELYHLKEKLGIDGLLDN